MKLTLQHDEHYIASLARLQDDRVLKFGNTFAVFDQHGDINLYDGEQGLFHEDTRFLSRLSIRIDEKKPTLLGSTVRDDNVLLIVDLANPDMGDGETRIGAKSLHIERSIFVFSGGCIERMTLRNYCDRTIEANLTFDFSADFQDIFEVRGEEREARGTLLPPVVTGNAIRLRYVGLDNVHRSTLLSWTPGPDELRPYCASFHCRVEPRKAVTLYFSATCSVEQDVDDKAAGALNFDVELAQVERKRGSMHDITCRITSSNQRFNRWIERSAADVAMVMTEMPSGERYPYAGVPWYSTVFGRDGLIIALQMLWVAPQIAKSVLLHLASRQATEFDDERDAEPGKILHEARAGEMARLGEVPFREYYGTVDATPLFVLVAGEHYRVTGDLEFARAIMPHIERALAWMDECGDADGDGFIEYDRKSAHGLSNQAWKDSFDSVMHADSELAHGPIAMCEVQGYAYAAKEAAAMLYEAMGDASRAASLRAQADMIRKRFDEAFWCEEIGTYALALDGEKRPCCVRASNPGHCLLTGIVPEARRAQVAGALLSPDMYSGWGIRTLSERSARYSPMAYHNGSIWPHDNSIIAAGLARCGMTERVLPIVDGLFRASVWFDRHRLPELFCGFARRFGGGPIGYPVACSPQGWASASAILLVQAMLGLVIDAPGKRLRFVKPRLPPGVDELAIANLSVGEATVSVRIARAGRGARVDIAQNTDGVDIQIEEPKAPDE